MGLHQFHLILDPGADWPQKGAELASQARHQMDAPILETAARNVVAKR